MMCLSLMKNPVTLVPCGHNFCQSCASASAGCGECGPGAVVTARATNEALDALCGKYQHRMHELGALQKAMSASAPDLGESAGAWHR